MRHVTSERSSSCGIGQPPDLLDRRSRRVANRKTSLVSELEGRIRRALLTCPQSSHPKHPANRGCRFNCCLRHQARLGRRRAEYDGGNKLSTWSIRSLLDAIATTEVHGTANDDHRRPMRGSRLDWCSQRFKSSANQTARPCATFGGSPITASGSRLVTARPPGHSGRSTGEGCWASLGRDHSYVLAKPSSRRNRKGTRSTWRHQMT